MKRKTFLISLFTFLCVSCATMQNIYTFKADYGQLYFVRSTSIKHIPNSLKSFDCDITLKVSNEGKLIEDPILNYTITCNKSNYQSAEMTEFSFVCDNREVYPQSIQLVYKEILNNKDLEIRYTSTINKDEFLSIIDSHDLKLHFKTGKDIVEQNDKVFSGKIAEIGVLL